MANTMFFPSRANVANSYAGSPNVAVSRPSVKSKSSEKTTSDAAASPSELDMMNPGLYPVRTRSLGGALSAAVVFERDSSAQIEQHPDDIIIVTVKLSRKERRNSFDDPLPERPPPRSFLRRMSTRILAQGDGESYKAVKMPRSEYLAHFRHDRDGKYAGSEPQREWREEEIVERYAQYQEMPLRHAHSGAGW